MEGIEFETDQGSTTTYSTTPKQSGMLKLLGKVGINDATTASFILLGITAALFGVAIFLYAGILGEPAKDWSLDARAIQLMNGR